MRKEMQIIEEIQHKQIIKTHGLFHDSINYYIVSDIAHGGDLFQYINERQSETLD